MSNSWLLFSFISISHSVTKCVCSVENIDLSSITKASTSGVPLSFLYT